MKDLLESGIHFGHQTRRWNPKMGRYIFGERHGIYIIDLQKTIRQLRRAYIAVRDTVAQGGEVLFVGTKKQAQEPIKTQAERCGMFFINNRWLGGTLTNWETIQQSIATMARYQDMEASGKMEAYSKKEASMMRKRREKLEKNLGGIQKMDGPPALLFIVDSHREDIAVAEAKRLNIPSVAICDTNSDPEVVTIPIPGNDDAIRAINLFCTIIADAVLEGRMRFDKAKQDELAKKKAAAAEETVRSEKLAKQQLRDADPADAAAQAEAAPKADKTEAAGEPVAAAAGEPVAAAEEPETAEEAKAETAEEAASGETTE
jgi:small subunit ribosomal protein S2